MFIPGSSRESAGTLNIVKKNSFFVSPGGGFSFLIILDTSPGISFRRWTAGDNFVVVKYSCGAGARKVGSCVFRLG